MINGAYNVSYKTNSKITQNIIAQYKELKSKYLSEKWTDT